MRRTPPKHKEWVALARSIDELNRGALLASLAQDSSGRVKERIQAIAKWPKDPRTVDALHRIVRDLPWVSSGSRPTWTQLFKLLKELGDPRSAKLARAFDPSSIKSSWTGPAEYMAGRLASVADAIEAQDQPELLSDEDQAFAKELLSSLPAAPSGASHEALLQMVLDNPADEETRLVVADGLQELGDPRGTLIMLQHLKLETGLTKEQKKQEKQLLKDNIDELIGPIKAISLVRGREFERGFLSACEIKPQAHEHHLEKAMGHPLLATITKLRAPVSFALQEQLRSLRHLAILPNRQESLEPLFRSKRTLLLEVLECWIWNEDVELLQSVQSLPKLNKLILHGPDEAARRALRSDLAKKVDWIALSEPELGALVAALPSITTAKPKRISAFYEEEAPGEWSCEIILERKGANEYTRHLELSPVGGGWQGSMSRMLKVIDDAFTKTKPLQISNTEVRFLKKVRDEGTRASIREVIPSSIEFSMD